MYLLCAVSCIFAFFFFFQAEDGIRDLTVTGVQTCALPILFVRPPSHGPRRLPVRLPGARRTQRILRVHAVHRAELPRREKTAHHRARSEEHTSELQSQSNLVCRLLLEKKKKHQRAALVVDS